MKYSVEDLDFSKVNGKLEHLSKSEIVDIVNSYYDDVKIATLINKFQIDSKTTSLYKLFPPKKLDVYCEH